MLGITQEIIDEVEMGSKIEELIKAGELATGGEWVGKYSKLSDQCPAIGDENSVFVNLSANARPAIKAMYEENIRLREALEHAVSIAEGDQAGNWDDLLEYRKTLNGGRDDR